MEAKPDTEGGASSRVTQLRISKPPERPTVIWDGDCGFCGRSARRLDIETRGQLALITLQEAEGPFPEIPREDLEQAVHTVLPDGRVFAGAASIFTALAAGGRYRWLQALYDRSAAFASVCEWAYGRVANNRYAISRATRWLIGESLEPSTYRASSWLFVRLLGVISLIAILSFWVQAEGLIGGEGLLPFAPRFEAMSSPEALEQTPWIAEILRGLAPIWQNPTDTGMHLTFGLAAFGAILLIVGRLPWLGIIITYASYLALYQAGGLFLSFQWDILLLETLFLSLFFVPWALRDPVKGRAPPATLARLLIGFLLFRLMFESGIVKLQSYGPSDANTWRDWTALNFHYWTQPLPTWTSWWAEHLPGWVDRLSLAVMFFIELVVPFLMVTLRRVRTVCALLLIGLQLLIIATGNYGYFNILTALLAVTLIDDQVLPNWLRNVFAGGDQEKSPRKAGAAADGEGCICCGIRFPAKLCQMAVSPFVTVWPKRVIVALIAIFLMPAYVAQLRDSTLDTRAIGEGEVQRAFRMAEDNEAWHGYIRMVNTLHLANGYGLFRVMTETRPEIIVEMRASGGEWIEIPFRWKPEALSEKPRYCVPHMPRLDWQMWFAALAMERNDPRAFSQLVGRHPRFNWLRGIIIAVSEGRPEVIELLDGDPFEGKDRPKEFRVTLWQYSFTTPEEKSETGNWWKREFMEGYVFQGRL